MPPAPLVFSMLEELDLEVTLILASLVEKSAATIFKATSKNLVACGCRVADTARVKTRAYEIRDRFGVVDDSCG